MTAAIALPVGLPPSVELPVPCRRWLLHPVIDMVFACGGLLFLLLGIHYLLLPQAFSASANITEPFPVLGLIGTILIADSHNMATLLQLYRNPERRNRLWFVSYLGAAVCAGLGVCAVFDSSIASMLARLYLVFIVQHVLAQTYGLALLYCEKRNYRFGTVERQVFKLLMQSVTVFAILRQFADPWKFRASFFGNPLPVWGSIPPVVLQLAHAAFLGMLAAFLVVVVRKAVREHRWLPMPSCMLVASALLVGFLGGQAAGVLSLYIPAFFHGSQYLVVSAAAHLKAQGASYQTLTDLLVSKELWRYWASLIVAAIVTFAIVPQTITLIGVTFPVAFFAVFAAVNFHHFLADAFLWRLRDPAVKKLVVA